MGRQDADGFESWHAKNRDPYTFRPADDFYGDLYKPESQTKQPESIEYHAEDQTDGKGGINPACAKYGKIFRFNDGTFLLVQFMRPRVWRLRFSPHFTAQQYSDFNTRTIVQDSLTELVDVLDKSEGIKWKVNFKTVDTRYYLLESVMITNSGKEDQVVQLWIQRNPFRITAVRDVASAGTAALLPALQHPALEFDAKHQIPPAPGRRNAIVWQTKERGLLYQGDATVINVDKPQTAKYLGFGEQGGRSLYKDKTFMNYFNFDNMRYYNIYDRGPLEDAEPLYHSEPYWIEVNAHPGYMTQVASFIDNYSHVALDVGKTDGNRLSIATRFNSFQGIFMAGDDIGQIIQLYTSLIGRPWLRPRYVLGNHQGCYGYETQDLVEYNAAKYREAGIPLDGMHIDVDIQRGYRTFTIDTREGHFPDPKGMFRRLRENGVRCSTNITPVIAINPKDPDFTYPTLESGWKGSGATNDRKKDNYWVRDIRDNDPSVYPESDVRYLQFGKGTRYFTNPTTQRPEYGDNYDFAANRNSGWPFHGGVDYGGDKGSPGFYPNLNKKEVRIWWGEQYKYLFESGLDFVWQDMTSPCMAQQYGDMKSWPFRLLLDSDGWPNDPNSTAQNKAIEIWALYSFNLHKATFKGLSRMSGREDKRNFIIGRGSFAGAQRYAGLWTGDNSSTWDFFNISVAQVLALGLGGVAISGADVGGFEPVSDDEHFADPELLVRWYGAYSLLPWFRNHYVRKGKKWFQEPFEYENYRLTNTVPPGQEGLYQAVLPSCRYLIRLRYSLLQLMYDAMFENLINGLPIARAMVITDPLDASLFSSNEWYTAHQYVVRHDLLVAPVLYKSSQRSTRKVYLPAPDGWYQLNLRPDTNPEGPGAALGPRIRGGSYLEYDARISHEESQLPFNTPMFVREGAIIPQIEVRQSTPDRTQTDIPALVNEPANPVTFHIYPGKDNKYSMYLDDGVSRHSAPTNAWLSQNEVVVGDDNGRMLQDAYGDKKAADAFREVVVTQSTLRRVDETTRNWSDYRTITINTPIHTGVSGFTDKETLQTVGPEYRVAIWHPDNIDMSTVKIVTTDGCSKEYKPWTNTNTRVTLLRVPTGQSVSAKIVVLNSV